MKFKSIFILAGLIVSAIPALAQKQTACNFNSAGALKAYLKPGKREMPFIMAHQGGTEDGLPGNSMATFEKTYQNVPCVLLEFDVRTTADGVLVISHDDDLSLRTNANGLLSKTSWEYAGEIKLKDSRGSITEYSMPTLQELLVWSKAKNLILIVDKKPETNIRKTIDMLRASGNLNKSVLICYSLGEARIAHQLAPDLMLAVGFNDKKLIAAVEKSGLPMENLVALTPRELQDMSFYEKIHQLNVIASLGTNGNIDTLQSSVSKSLYQKIVASGGPDIICTDNPVLVQNIFYKKE
ncbi:glycerophosphodiester phosphodiesterase family protein [Dyadobacter sp. CY323]|uniref:glycerophosphodiester phosphodiesterase family protein n=1 Tax=Dyadobacter sp. CY323 TaxID=2907302 RepID=UPI001F162411|nr:glycerophosphodiester phosphodiesterase family protein [Dyadobacter sp. CY323]MCE6991641.1 glycerophosphodiester phosphodiesterase family protein [Dyadobacter sp. CY323]